MADARRVRAERRTTRIAQTAPIGDADACGSPSPNVNATTRPEVQEQLGSSQTQCESVDGRITTLSLARPSGSASCARPEMPHVHCMLAMATGLLETAMMTGSIASRSSSPQPVTQRRSPARSDPSPP
ncbi:hypothetical protein D1007_04116 [Hordeum vulgare]|nr:hypothetical protein D1007_04116 [Hordeum vulgare]